MKTTWDIAGLWVGEYSYHDRGMAAALPKVIPFSLTARIDGSGRFSGFVQDDPTSGGVPAEATIVGRVIGDRITFRKRYPTIYVHRRGRTMTVREQIRADRGLHLSRDVPSWPIDYRGIYDPDLGTVAGLWQIGSGFVLSWAGWCPLWFGVGDCSGNWSLRRPPDWSPEI